MGKSRPRSARYQTGKSNKNTRKPAAANSRRQQLILVVGLTVFLLSAAAFTLLQDRQPAAAPAAERISVDQAYQEYSQGAFLLDVRQPEEWDEYHVPDSMLIPLGELEKRVNELPEDQEIIVVCRSGNRSQEGRDILLSAGFSQVSSMDGGLKDWRDAGYPITSGP